MNIHTYKGNQKEWDDFVECSYNGTIFHKQRFLSYHSPKKFNDCSLLFKEGKTLLSIFPAAIVGNSLISHPGSSFGGPVFQDTSIQVVLDTITLIVNFAEEKKIETIKMRLPPNIVKEYPIEAVEYSLFYKGFYLDAVELGTCVPLGIMYPTYESTRKARRSNEEGVVVRESDDWEKFWLILYDNLERHNTTPTHSIVDIRRLIGLFPNDIRLFGAYFNEKLIAGIVLFINNKVSFETFYIAQNYEYNQYHPVNLLITRVMEWAIYNQFKFMNFGISTEDSGRKINLGLSKFKESFGGCDVVRKTYRMDL